MTTNNQLICSTSSVVGLLNLSWLTQNNTTMHRYFFRNELHQNKSVFVAIGLLEFMICKV